MTASLQLAHLDGRAVWIEVTEIPATLSSAPVDSRYTKTANTPTNLIQQVDLTPLLDSVVVPVRNALDRMGPAEVSVEFSVGFKGEIGFFLAKGETNAALKITAKWTQKK